VGTKRENFAGDQAGQLGAEIERLWKFPWSIIRGDAGGGREISYTLHLHAE